MPEANNSAAWACSGFFAYQTFCYSQFSPGYFICPRRFHIDLFQQTGNASISVVTTVTYFTNVTSQGN